MERGKEREEAWSFDGASDGKRTAAKESEENKENLILNVELKDDLLLYQDEEALNDSIISGEQRVGLLGQEPPSRGMEPKGRFGGSWVEAMCQRVVERDAPLYVSRGLWAGSGHN